MRKAHRSSQNADRKSATTRNESNRRDSIRICTRSRQIPYVSA